MLNSIDLVSHATHLLTLYINLLNCECWTHVEYKFLGVSVARSDLARVFVAHALNRENSLTGDCSIMQLCRLEESRRERKHKVSKKNKNTGKILEKYWKKCVNMSENRNPVQLRGSGTLNSPCTQLSAHRSTCADSHPKNTYKHVFQYNYNT